MTEVSSSAQPAAPIAAAIIRIKSDEVELAFEAAYKRKPDLLTLTSARILGRVEGLRMAADLLEGSPS